MDFYDTRLFGWDIVMAMDPKTGRTDGRTRRCKEAGELMRDLIFNRPDFDTLLAAVREEQDIALLWPTAMQEVVRFRLAHKVPRDINEPTSNETVAKRLGIGHRDWPKWLLHHCAIASVDDHPPFPPRSDVYRSWEAGAALSGNAARSA